MGFFGDTATRRQCDAATAALSRGSAGSCCRLGRVLILSVLLTAPPAQAQGQVPDISYTRHSTFRIPFRPENQADRRLKQIHLYLSTDQGRTWHPIDSVVPERGYFDFQAKADGLYWFTVRTVDTEGRAYPITMENARPGLKVVVDTQPPVVNLRALPARDGMTGVEWEVRDDNLDPLTIRLEYRLPGGAEWFPLRSDPLATGQYYWQPATNAALEVRLSARDRAENQGVAKVTVGGSGQVSPPTEVQPRTTPDRSLPRPSGFPGDSAVRLVNSKRISLNYELKEVGPSGISAVELWYTRDGRNWQKYGEDANKKPPFVFDVNDEGVYGFTLVVRSGVGLGGRTPQVGEPPQVWVEVDLTKPIVRLLATDVSRDPENKTMTIMWSASDKNLASQPITLSYAEQPDGPWKAFATKVENSGRYVWQMPADVPYKILIRVEAADRAGNIGGAETAKHVIVDLSQPKGVILDVAPATKPE